jgi:hypothetical protein
MWEIVRASFRRLFPRRLSSQHLTNYVPVHVREPAVRPVVIVSQLLVIQAEQMQNRRIEIVYRRDRFDRAPPEFIGGAVADAALDARTHQPDREAVRVVIAPRRPFLMRRHAPELGGPENKDIFEHTALFQIGEQGRRRLIEDRAMALVIGLQRAVGVPVE